MSRNVAAPGFLPDVPETREDFADYRMSAMQLDLHMGSVLGVLDEAGLAENTIVVMTTDHGMAAERQMQPE